MNKILVAVDTGTLRHAPVPRLDANRIGVVLHRESERMKESVIGFRDPLADCVVGQVAIVADGHVMMTGILPRIVLVLHRMTVHAGLGIIAQVAGTFAVTKGERPDAGKPPQHDRESNRPATKPHLAFLAGLGRLGMVT